MIEELAFIALGCIAWGGVVGKVAMLIRDHVSHWC